MLSFSAKILDWKIPLNLGSSVTLMFCLEILGTKEVAVAGFSALLKTRKDYELGA